MQTLLFFSPSQALSWMALGVKQKNILKDKSYISQILRISVNKLVCYVKLLTEWSVFQPWRALTQVLMQPRKNQLVSELAIAVFSMD